MMHPADARELAATIGVGLLAIAVTILTVAAILAFV